jgi:hypothetical protein
VRTQLARRIPLIALLFLLNGCAPINSIFPLYLPEDTAFDSRLIGNWQPALTDPDTFDKNSRWFITKSGKDKFYDFKWGTADAKGGFVAKARLVQLGANLFIDFEGDDDSLEAPEKNQTANIAPFPTISTHMIGRVWLEKDTLRIQFLSDDWIKKQVKAGTLSLAHVDPDGEPILIAKTDDLRKFMQAHADDTDALSEKYEFKRVK